MGNNIILVGMPASGKSYICKLLSERLPEYVPMDTDSIIEKTYGMSIPKIFEKYSEDTFRKYEYDTIKMVSSGSNKIIATGGGAFENPDSRNTLLNSGIVFYLKSDIDVLYYRISDETKRPLLNVTDRKQALMNLLNKREENYQKAHYTVDTSKMSEEEIVNFILEKLNETASTR